MAFLFYVLLIFLLMLLILMSSNIQIDIQKFKYTRKKYKNVVNNKKETKTDSVFFIKVKLYVLKVIPITFLKIDNNKIDKLKENKTFIKIGKKLKSTMDKMQKYFVDKILKNQSQKTVINVVTVAKELRLKFKEIDFNVDVGVSDVIATSFLIPVITTIISFFLRNTIIDSNQSKFSVNPIYNLENYGSEINIFLKCIIEVKMIHIINIMYIIKKQRKVNNHVKPSNRRAYDYSYE